MERPDSIPPSACLFRDLTFELLDSWLASDGDILSSSIQRESAPHIRLEVLRHSFGWNVDVHLDLMASEGGESGGLVSASMLTSSIYGVPPVPEFSKRFNAQGLSTHLSYAWADRHLNPGNMFHLVFESERHFQADEPIGRADAIGLVGGLVDDTYLGTLATGMGWIFSRKGAL